MDKLPPEAADKLSESLAHAGIQFAGRMAGRGVLVGAIMSMITSKIVAKFVAQRAITLLPSATVVGVAVTGALFYGMVERASNASRRLEKVNPRLSQKLRNANLDMLYFIVEDEMAPFVTLTAVKLQRPADYDQWVSNMVQALK